MRNLKVFTLIDLFIAPSQIPRCSDDWTKSRIFVVGALLLAAISIMDLLRLMLSGLPYSGTSEFLELGLAALSLIIHYRFGSPQYVILPFAASLVLLICIADIFPGNSLLVPAIQWLPLIVAAIFFVSGRWWGTFFAMLILLVTLVLQWKYLQMPLALPWGETQAAFVSKAPVFLFEVMTASTIMALVYMNLHRRSRQELMSVQNQVAEAFRAAENSDFSYNLHQRIEQRIKPIRSRLRDGKSTTDCDDDLKELRTSLMQMKDFTVTLRSMHEAENQIPSGQISWEHFIESIRNFFPGRHGLMHITLSDNLDKTRDSKVDERLVLILIEGLQLLCYQTKASGQGHLHLSTRILAHELTIIYTLTLGRVASASSDELELNEQKLEISSRMLLQNLEWLGGTVQSRQKNLNFWLQIALPLTG